MATLKPTLDVKRKRGETPERAAREAEMLNVAAKLFAENGYRDASLNSIADAAGITRQGVLHYYPSKQKLLLALLKERERSDRARVRTVLEQYPADVVRVLEALVEHNAADLYHTWLHTVLSAEATASSHPAHDYFRDRYRRVHSALAQSIAKQTATDASDERVRNLARIAIAAMDGLQVQWLLDPTVDMVAAFTVFADMLTQTLAGLLP